MLLRTYDYTIDQNSPIIRSGQLSDGSLAKACPILVAELRAKAAEVSSVKLYMIGKRAQTDIKAGMLLSALFGGKSVSDIPDEGVRTHVREAGVILAITTSELSRRYQNNTLEPELHAGDKASAQFAEEGEKLEDSQQSPTTEEQPRQDAVVNGVSDGIV